MRSFPKIFPQGGHCPLNLPPPLSKLRRGSCGDACRHKKKHFKKGTKSGEKYDCKTKYTPLYFPKSNICLITMGKVVYCIIVYVCILYNMNYSAVEQHPWDLLVKTLRFLLVLQLGELIQPHLTLTSPSDHT